MRLPNGHVKRLFLGFTCSIIFLVIFALLVAHNTEAESSSPAASVAKEKALALGNRSSFRGFRIEEVDYNVREFTCKACTNYCDVQEFTVEGRSGCIW